MTRNRKKKAVNLNKVVKNAKGVNLNQKSVNQALALVKKVNTIREGKRKQVYNKPYRQIGLDNPTTINDIKLMSKTDFQELNDVYFNVNSVKSQTQLNERIKSLKSMTTKKYYNNKNRVYKQNFLSSIDTVYGGKVDQKLIDEYKKMVKYLNAEEVANLRYSNEITDLEQRYLASAYADVETINDYFFEDLSAIRQAYNTKRERVKRRNNTR